MIELADPWALLLLPVPWLVAWVLPMRTLAGAALEVPDRLGARLMASQGVGGQTPKRLMLWATWGLLVLALAGPRSLAPVEALKVSGRDLAVVVDLSGSMVRDDFHLDGTQITRLDAVKTVGAAFARRRAGDRVAFVVFGSEAFVAASFTFDVEAVAARIEEATIGISGRATNISDGLGLALKRMARSAAETKVVVLLSDGVHNAGTTHPRGVAELAAAQGVRVHTIALGPKDLTEAEEGERGVVDAATLRAVSRISGGESFRVRTTSDLADVAVALDRSEPTEGAGLSAAVYRDYWPWVGALALVLCGGLIWREEA